MEDVPGHHDMNRLTIVGLITQWSQDCCSRNTSFLDFSRCKDLLGSLGCGKEDVHYRWYVAKKEIAKTLLWELGLGFRVGSTRGTVKAELFREMVYPSSTCQDWTPITWNMIGIHYSRPLSHVESANFVLCCWFTIVGTWSPIFFEIVNVEPIILILYFP